MDCAEFRRRLLVDPRDDELVSAAQLRVCPDAPEQLAEALALEQRLQRALAVPVPGDLAEAILTAVPAAANAPVGKKPWRLKWPLAMAAALVAVALVVGWPRWQTSATENLIAASVDHLAHEPYALTRTSQVPTPLIESMFKRAGVDIDAAAFDLNYLNRCPLGKQWSIHMVLQSASGPVTLMYVPGADGIDRIDTRHDMVAVRALPHSHGALVMLAENNQDFDQIEQRWRQALREQPALAGGER